MNFYKTSRKDDIVSLYFMMVWLLNNDDLIGDPEDIAGIKALKRTANSDVDVDEKTNKIYGLSASGFYF